MKSRFSFLLISFIASGLLFVLACSQPGDISPPTPPASAPDAPASVSFYTGTQTSVTISWSSVATADTYSIYRSASPDGAYSPFLIGITGVSFTVNGLESGAYYYFKISASNTAGESGLSDAITAFTSPTYAQAYNAFLLDHQESIAAMYAARANNPATGNGSWEYPVTGANGGTASLTYIVNIQSSYIVLEEFYSWNSYKGNHRALISGSLLLQTDTAHGNTAYGGESSYYLGDFGSVVYSLSINGAGTVSGTYAATFAGVTHTYDYATNTMIN